jgi:hypothetical protein
MWSWFSRPKKRSRYPADYEQLVRLNGKIFKPSERLRHIAKKETNISNDAPLFDRVIALHRKLKESNRLRVIEWERRVTLSKKRADKEAKRNRSIYKRFWE